MPGYVAREKEAAPGAPAGEELLRPSIRGWLEGLLGELTKYPVANINLYWPERGGEPAAWYPSTDATDPISGRYGKTTTICEKDVMVLPSRAAPDLMVVVWTDLEQNGPDSAELYIPTEPLSSDRWEVYTQRRRDGLDMVQALEAAKLLET